MLLEWGDNIGISSKSPEVYLPKMISGYSKEELNNMYFWHALWEGWESKSYLGFLEEWRKRIAEVILSGFETFQKSKRSYIKNNK